MKLFPERILDLFDLTRVNILLKWFTSLNKIIHLHFCGRMISEALADYQLSWNKNWNYIEYFDILKVRATISWSCLKAQLHCFISSRKNKQQKLLFKTNKSSFEFFLVGVAINCLLTSITIRDTKSRFPTMTIFLIK